ncbi:MAG: sigma-70 family RNA polymerase sigma factor [Candidatus Sumerlaeota bacterium]
MIAKDTMTHDRPRHSPEPDTALRRAFHDGSPDAVDAIVTMYFTDVLRYSISLLRDEETAMEAVQETFLRVVEYHRTYDHTRLFRPWLFTICRKCCGTMIKQRVSRAAKIVELDEELHAISKSVSPAPSAIETLLREESEGIVIAALQELPEASRTVVFLHIFEDMTFKDIGTVTAMPAASVSTLYYRALLQLRKRLVAPVPGDKEVQHHAS